MPFKIAARAVAALSVFALLHAAPPSQGIDALRYQATVKKLASPEMKGRGTGSPELENAARYLATQFEKIGIPPADGKNYYQRFNVTTNARLGDRNFLTWTLDGAGSSNALKPAADFQPFNFSGNGTVSGEVVFAGYGITAPEYNYDDYAGIDVKDKIVLLLRHEPQEFEEKSVFAGKAYTRHAQIDYKASNARLHGAKAVLFVNDVSNHTDPDALDKFSRIVGPGGATLPFVQVTGAVADQWLKTANTTFKDWIANVDHLLKPNSLPLPGLTVKLSASVERETRQVPNVCAYLKGETDEYIILGAHYDHLGMGEFSSMAPSQAGKAVHHGADDNASGTAGLIELAHYFKAQPRLKRGILFLAFSGEELGLLGSNHYVGTPVLPLDKAVAMINMDMIGRINEGRVFVGGAGTGTTLTALIEEARKTTDLKLDLSEQGGYGSSDHMSFNIKQVPVLFFFSGLHPDYHKPSDTWDKINHVQAAQLLSVVGDISLKLINNGDRPQYVRLAEPGSRGIATASASSGYGPYFGSVPDMGQSEGGAKLSDVRDGSPAQKAGLKGGDTIYEFGGKPVGNLMDFTVVLRSFKPGDEVTVKWRRNGADMEGRATLTSRK